MVRKRKRKQEMAVEKNKMKKVRDGIVKLRRKYALISSTVAIDGQVTEATKQKHQMKKCKHNFTNKPSVSCDFYRKTNS